MNKTVRLIVAVLCLAVITACAVLIARKAVGRARLDLTENANYTLSAGTKNILAKINQPIRLKLYYSRAAALKGPEGFRFFNNYFLYVRDLLEEYVSQSGGKLTLTVIDPRAFTEAEEQAIQEGVKRFQLSQDESFFFGLVAETELGNRKTLEFFEPNRQEFVEYDISKTISAVTQREKKKIGVLSPLPVMGDDSSPMMRQMLQMQGREVQEPWSIISHLQDIYQVEAVEKDVTEIPAGIDYLMVVHPKDFSDKTLFAIDQFVMKGGKLLVFADPHCLADRPPADPRNPWAGMEYKSESSLNNLLEKWGVRMAPGEIAVDATLAIAAPLQRNQAPRPLAAFFDLSDANMNRNEIISANLHQVRMLFAGSLEAPGGEEGRMVPLITTSDKGSVWKPQSPMDLQFLDAQKIYQAALGGSRQIVLAARLNGPFETNYPDGLTVWENEGDDSGEPEKTSSDDKPTSRLLESVKKSSDEAAVVVFADVDFITDMLAYEKIFFGTAVVGDNAALVFNALDFLSGSPDLIAIRSRGRYERPFAVVDRIEQETEQATSAQVERLNKEIQEYQDKLSQLGRAAGADDSNVEVIKNTALEERRKIEEQIRKAQKQLRQINSQKRDKIEALKQRLQLANMLGAPSGVLIIAIVLSIVRIVRAKRYAARRTD
ncbi:MAG: GldG family protein [Candidatus Sumerlaeia bacterium]